MRIAWRTFADLTALCRANVGRVRELAPDVIVGIPRSGMLPASLLAMSVGLPLADLHSFCAGRAWRIGGERNGCDAARALLVDDASGYGRAMTRALAMASEARPGTRIMTSAVYADPEAVDLFTLVMEPLAKPRLFDWNWWRSGKLAHCCVDIDGVLCPDPTSAQKRDPEAYRAFIAGAPLLYRPAKTVGAFVTGRSDTYRTETEAWLRAHCVSYGTLAMLNGASPRSVEAHADHKAGFYARSEACLFIESDERQAELIARISGKPALCVTTGRLH